MYIWDLVTISYVTHYYINTFTLYHTIMTVLLLTCNKRVNLESL